MYKVLIVDDEPLVQVGIKSMLNCDKFNLEICGTASNGEAALDLIRRQNPDIVICDIKMPKMDGLELIKKCRDEFGYDKPVFIFLTSFEELRMVKEALAYHASDYLVKLELTAELLDDAIEKAIKTLPAPEVSAPANGTNAVMNYTEKFYIRLLQNLIADQEQLDAQRNFLNIELNADGYQCVHISFLEQTGNQLSPEKKFSLYLSSLELLRELIVKYFPAVVVSLDVRHCALIIELQQKDDGLFPDRNRILETLQVLNENLEKYYNTPFIAGIGSPVTCALEVSSSYQYAKHAYTYANETVKLRYIEDCDTLESGHRLFNLSLFKDNLSQAFEEFDEQQLARIIDELCALFITYPDRTVQALDVACSFLYMAISSLPSGEQTMTELYAEYPDHYCSIYRQKSMEQIVSWLNTFKDKLCDYFVQRKGTHTHHTVNQVKQYIQEHVSERFSLNDVADKFYITPNYLSQLFKRYNDMGFNEYITFCKIKEAKKLMQEGKLKIYEISDMLGFENSFYFSKVFKKVEGVAPKEYMTQKIN